MFNENVWKKSRKYVHYDIPFVSRLKKEKGVMPGKNDKKQKKFMDTSISWFIFMTMGI